MSVYQPLYHLIIQNNFWYGPIKHIEGTDLWHLGLQNLYKNNDTLQGDIALTFKRGVVAFVADFQQFTRNVWGGNRLGVKSWVMGEHADWQFVLDNGKELEPTRTWYKYETLDVVDDEDMQDKYGFTILVAKDSADNEWYALLNEGTITEVEDIREALSPSDFEDLI